MDEDALIEKGAGLRRWLSKCLPQRCEALGVVLRTHRVSGVAMHTFNPSAGGVVTGGTWGLLVSQCHLTGELLATGDPVSKEVTNVPEDVLT